MLRALLKIVGTIVLLIVALVGWIAYRAHDAKTRVTAFCNSVHVGQASEGLAERARSEGLEVLQVPPQEEGAVQPAGTLMCIKGVMLARHICDVSFSAGRVTKVDMGFID